MASAKFVPQFFSTVRHLQSRQITGQVRNRLNYLFENPETFYSQPAPESCGCRWYPKRAFLPPGLQKNCAADISAGNFIFLNSKQNIGCPVDWNITGLPKLWLYNLHYFEYLWDLDYTQSKMLVLDWIKRHPLRRKHLGWEPYPVSLRTVNLCCIFFNKYRRQTENDPAFHNELWSSIYIQAQWLLKHLETHLLGNHLLENSAALIFAGCCFTGESAEKWYKKGKEIIADQIHEQILSDGMHFERSPMYHLRVTYLLAILLNINRLDLNELVKEPLRKMLTALQYLCHPDEDIALLNDSAFGIYNSPRQLLAYAENLLGSENTVRIKDQSGPFALPEAGYYGFSDRDGTYLVCDAAPIGPDYIPGHAHADMFSFELSLDKHRIIVDSGVYDYEISPTREYCRSTKAHNTVEIDGEDQCEMWAAFRVARRGKPKDVEWKQSEDGFQLSAWLDSYERLKGRPVHSRKFDWHKSGGLTVHDFVNSSCSQNIISRLHLHPDCEIVELKENTALVIYPAGKIMIIFSGNCELAVEDSYYCPEFGVKIPNKALASSCRGSKIETGFQIKKL